MAQWIDYNIHNKKKIHFSHIYYVWFDLDSNTFHSISFILCVRFFVKENVFTWSWRKRTPVAFFVCLNWGTPKLKPLWKTVCWNWNSLFVIESAFLKEWEQFFPLQTRTFKSVSYFHLLFNLNSNFIQFL